MRPIIINMMALTSARIETGYADLNKEKRPIGEVKEDTAKGIKVKYKSGMKGLGLGYGGRN